MVEVKYDVLNTGTGTGGTDEPHKPRTRTGVAPVDSRNNGLGSMQQAQDGICALGRGMATGAATITTLYGSAESGRLAAVVGQVAVQDGSG
jgi:hypothetical protein